jgi:hypothetical protein
MPIDDPTQKMHGDCIADGGPLGSHFCGFDAAGMMLDHLLKNVNGTDFKSLNPKDFEHWRDKGVIR